jgi:hypothetical protein
MRTLFYILAFWIGSLSMQLWLDRRPRRRPRPRSSDTGLDLIEWWLVDRMELWEQNKVDAAQVAVLELVLLHVRAMQSANRRDKP